MERDEYGPTRTRAKLVLRRGSRAPPTRRGVMVLIIVVGGAAVVATQAVAD